MTNSINQNKDKFNLKNIKENLNKENNEEIILEDDEESKKFKENLKEIYVKKSKDFNEKLKVKIKKVNKELEPLDLDPSTLSNLKIDTSSVPDYLQNTYYWAYLNPKNVKRLDRNIVVDTLLFGNARRLIKTYLNEIKEGDSVLQIAHVYGDLVKKIAKKVGEKGSFDLIDIAPVQLAQAYKKLKDFKNVDIWQQDATVPYHRTYDVIGSFFLLHEVPMKAKVAIVENMLQKVSEDNAKAVFIDYHYPVAYHPVKPILSLVNTFLEPYAHELWNYEIKDFAKEPEKYNWKKTTIFGDVYQKVVVTKK